MLPWPVDCMTWNLDGSLGTQPVEAAKTRGVWTAGVAAVRAKQDSQAKGFAVLEKRPVK